MDEIFRVVSKVKYSLRCMELRIRAKVTEGYLHQLAILHETRASIDRRNVTSNFCTWASFDRRRSSGERFAKG
jgi:hypothetical protein